MAGQTRPLVTDTNFSPIVQVLTWLLLAGSFLAVTLRLLTRFYLQRRAKLDDLLIVIAFFFSLGQSITLLVHAGGVWGKSLQELDRKFLNSGLKSEYAGELLFIPCVCFAKLSIPIALLAVTPIKQHRWAIYVLELVVAFYGLTAEVTIAFKCGVPQPWNYLGRSCLNRRALALYIGIFNILTDFGLIALPTAIIAPLQMSIVKRWTVISLFAARLLVIAATITQLSYLHRIFNSDFTFDSWVYVVCTQVVQALSVMTACVPYLQQFIVSLNTGLLWKDDMQATGQSSSNYVSYDLNNSRREYTNLDSQSGQFGAGRSGGSTELATMRDKYEIHEEFI